MLSLPIFTYICAFLLASYNCFNVASNEGSDELDSKEVVLVDDSLVYQVFYFSISSAEQKMVATRGSMQFNTLSLCIAIHSNLNSDLCWS